MEKIIILFTLLIMTIGCSNGSVSKKNTDLPYKGWVVTGRYPEPFTAKINQMMALTESDELKMLSVRTDPYNIDENGKWGEAYMGG